jgi:hypothetical protein
MSTSYRPELDARLVHDPEMANWYQSATGVLVWADELGRIDITTETSMLASHMTQPRETHFVAVLRIFSCLRTHHNSRIAFDPTYREVDHQKFLKNDWRRFYAIGKPVCIRIYVDSEDAGDHIARLSRTGYIMFLNSAVINGIQRSKAPVRGQLSVKNSI